jgi:hypothetical protein
MAKRIMIPKCKHCGNDIRRSGGQMAPGPWVHEDGFYRCADGLHEAYPEKM